MAQFIKIQMEETYQIPDEWELVTNAEGITKIKVKENEFYDFGSIPYCSASVEDDEEIDVNSQRIFGFTIKWTGYNSRKYKYFYN